MGVSPMTELKVRESAGQALPASIGVPTEALITSALAQPDVLAAFSAMKASQSAIKAAEAEFLPKVYLGAVAAAGTNLSAPPGLPTIGQQSSASGVVLGATMPIYDGGLRAAQLKTAESLAAVTEATFDKTRDAAARGDRHQRRHAALGARRLHRRQRAREGRRHHLRRRPRRPRRARQHPGGDHRRQRPADRAHRPVGGPRGRLGGRRRSHRLRARRHDLARRSGPADRPLSAGIQIGDLLA